MLGGGEAAERGIYRKKEETKYEGEVYIHHTIYKTHTYYIYNTKRSAAF